jgi:hypothetical protein
MEIAGEMRHLIDDPGEAIREGVVLPALQVVVMASCCRTVSYRRMKSHARSLP